MRIKLAFLLLFLVVCSLAANVKTVDKDKALAYKAKKEKEREALKDGVAIDEDDEVIETKSLAEVERDAGVEDDYDDEEEEQPKKKIIPVPDKAIIPNMTSFNFFEMTRKSRIDKLREIINETPTGNIEKMRQITEDLQEETSYDEDDNEYEACKETDDELCHCDMDEINCSDIVLGAADPRLHTADLVIQKKDFKPIIANFSQNAISKLKKNKVLPGFEKYVSSLDMSYNHVRFMDSDVFKPFTNLTKLNLSHNNLQTIKKQVFDTVKDTLHRLDIGYNRIKSLDDGVFEGLTNLKVLALDGNPIKNWKKEMFKGLDNLETLSLDKCSIEDLPADIFEYLPKLVGVSLRENPLEEIPSVIANFKSLKTVDMSITNLPEIRDHAFAGDSDLVEIILEKMPFLSAVKDCGFCGLPKLNILLLNDNKKLMEIHPNAFGFIKSDPGSKSAAITEFDFHGSNISTISEHMMEYDKLKTFKIGANPWKCNCETQFLLEEKMLFKSDSVAPKCASPENLKDHHLEAVRISEACESARFLNRSGRFSSVLGLALLVGFLAIGGYYMVSSGKLQKLVRQVRKEPEVSYTNLQAAGEDFALESDFQPRPAEV